MTAEELRYLESTCPYLSGAYLRFLQSFKLRPAQQVHLSFRVNKPTRSIPDEDAAEEDDDDEPGDLGIAVTGLWVDTILYEIPLLALTSEAYFRLCDRDWTYKGQGG